MKFFLAVTDEGWFRYLARQQPDEINFWRPSSKTTFRAIQPGAPFLFKLHSPNNFVVGGGFFVRHSILPISLAWEAFGNKNGADTFDAFYQSVMKYNRRGEVNPSIGCTILTEPFFLVEDEWIPVPEDWNKSIVQGRIYNTEDVTGDRLWDAVRERLGNQLKTEGELVYEEPARYGTPYEIRSRIGQGAFRVMVTDAYHRRCAITGEKTLPVLEAAHIKPFSQLGPNTTNNGLLLLSDMQILFDKGYVAIDDQMHIVVSRRIREEFENGREYYAYQGKVLANLPDSAIERPSVEFIRWHQEEIFRDR